MTEYNLFNQPELTGAFLKEKGILQAITHANQKIHKWSDKAYAHLLEYIKTNSQFKTEDARAYAEKQGLEEPPSKRAWGGVVLRAARSGFIIKGGHAIVDNPKAHNCLATLWNVVNK